MIENTRPECKMIGTDGNVFNMIGRASSTLKEAGMKEEAKEMVDKVLACANYTEAVYTINKYVKMV